MRHDPPTVAPAAPACPALLTLQQAATRCALGYRTIWSATACGELATVRIGRAVRIDPRDLADWIERHRGGGAR